MGVEKPIRHTIQILLTESGPILLDRSPGGAVARTALASLGGASSIRLFGLDERGVLWVLWRGLRASPGLVAPESLRTLTRNGVLIDEIALPPMWTLPAPPDRPAAERQIVISSKGQVAWASPGPKALEIWLYLPVLPPFGSP